MAGHKQDSEFDVSSRLMLRVEVCCHMEIIYCDAFSYILLFCDFASDPHMCHFDTIFITDAV